MKIIKFIKKLFDTRPLCPRCRKFRMNWAIRRGIYVCEGNKEHTAMFI